MTQTDQPRSVTQELHLIKRAIKRLVQNPDNKAAIAAMRQIQFEIHQAIGAPPQPNPADKSYAPSRDFIEA